MAGLIPVGVLKFGQQVFASVVGDRISHPPERVQGANHNELIEYAIQMIQHVDECLIVIAQNTAPPNDTLPGVVEYTAVIQADPAGAVFDRAGKPHFSLYCAATFSLIIDIPGIGRRTATTVAGWNQLEIPQGTVLSVANGGTATNVFVRCGDVPLGTLI